MGCVPDELTVNVAVLPVPTVALAGWELIEGAVGTFGLISTTPVALAPCPSLMVPFTPRLLRSQFNPLLSVGRFVAVNEPLYEVAEKIVNDSPPTSVAPALVTESFPPKVKLPPDRVNLSANGEPPLRLTLKKFV